MFEELRDKLLKAYKRDLLTQPEAKWVSFGEWMGRQEKDRGDWYEEAYVFLRYIGGDYK